MVTDVMTVSATGILADTDANAIIIFNSHSWSATLIKLSVDTNSVLLNSDVDNSFLNSQITPPLVLTTFTGAAPPDPHVGACIYDSGSAITTDSTVLSKNGIFVVLQQTITFNCKVTIQPISVPAAPAVDANYTVNTLIPCEYT
jgi:hypothetical protein